MIEKTIINVNGRDISLIRKSRLRNVNLRVNSQTLEITVSASKSTPVTFIKQFIESREEWLSKTLLKLEKTYVPPMDKKETKQYKKYLLKKLSIMVPYWEEKMGLRCDKYSVRKMNTRWGSCTPSTRQIRFNLELARREDAFIEYIIVHELCHLRFANHGKEFHALLASYLPDWKQRKKLQDKVI